jgi:C-terminal processing protease CtpA/Prc
MTARLILGLVLATQVCVATPSFPNFFTDTISKIKIEYVNPKKINLQDWSDKTLKSGESLCNPSCDENKLEELLFNRIASINDRHFYVYNPRNSNNDKLFGVGSRIHQSSFGFYIAKIGKNTFISYVHPDTPVSKILQRGDKILSVNKSAESLDVELASAERTYTGVDIEFERAGAKLQSTIFPGTQPWQSTSSSFEEYTWIRLANTNKLDERFLYESITKAKQAKSKGIVLDLRYTAGGSPFATINIAAAFTSKVGDVLTNSNGGVLSYVVTDGTIRYENKIDPQIVDESIEGFSTWVGPLVVLVSQHTFSGGENLAGYLQSLGRAPVLGTSTRGGGGVTVNAISVRFDTEMFLPQYRHSDPNGKPRPLQIQPDIAITESTDFIKDAPLDAAWDALRKLK